MLADNTDLREINTEFLTRSKDGKHKKKINKNELRILVDL